MTVNVNLGFRGVGDRFLFEIILLLLANKCHHTSAIKNGIPAFFCHHPLYSVHRLKTYFTTLTKGSKTVQKPPSGTSRARGASPYERSADFLESATITPAGMRAEGEGVLRGWHTYLSLDVANGNLHELLSVGSQVRAQFEVDDFQAFFRDTLFQMRVKKRLHRLVRKLQVLQLPSAFSLTFL